MLKLHGHYGILNSLIIRREETENISSLYLMDFICVTKSQMFLRY